VRLNGSSIKTRIEITLQIPGKYQHCSAHHSYGAMKPVIQQDVTGCGIASVATLARVTYRQAQSVAHGLGISAEDTRLWSDTAYVRTLLHHYGIRAADKEQPFHSWDTLPNLALLAIKWHSERSRAFWHWSVFYRGPHGAVVLDPKRGLRTNRRTDFGRMKPKWFIEILAPALVPRRTRAYS
jgi:ABC-type bacteriocin/lantibiotic exporter with double-glycine peptidase domain